MRFAIIRKADEKTEQGCMPSDALLKAMGEYNQRLVEAGVMVDGAGLKPSKDSARISFSNGVPSVTDGPFAETKELTAGYTIIEVNSKQEAVEWAKQWPVEDADGGVQLELRQFYEMEDFEPGEGLDLHNELAERMARQPQGMSTYLFFDGKCRQAFEFYADCLGGQIEGMMTQAEAPEQNEGCAMPAENILHACLRLGKWQLMGSDTPDGYFEKPRGFYVQIEINNTERAERAFERLAEGGQVQMPFAQTFWADRFGMLVDRFGIPWMINCNIGC